MRRDEIKNLVSFSSKIALAAASAAVLALVITFACHDRHSYAESIAPKLELLRTTPSPRVVILGGSGSALGFDSALFEKKTGIRTINMGVYAGLGMRFMTITATPLIRKDDVVVFLPEYELLQQPAWGDGYTLLEIIASDPSLVRYALNYHTVAAMARAFPGWLRDQATGAFERIRKTAPKTIYRIENVSAAGDLSSKDQDKSLLTAEEMKKASVDFIRPQADPQSIAFLQAFVSFAESKDAKVYISWPPLADITYTENKIAARMRQKEMSDQFGSILLGTPEDFIYPASDFYDAPTHLNAKGRELRTSNLADLFQKALLIKNSR